MSNRKFSKVFLWLAAILGVGAVYWISRSVFQLDAQAVRSWILSFGVAAPLIYIAVYTVRPLVLFPASILSIAGGLAFGPWMGTFYTIIGASLGAMLSFVLAKKIGVRLGKKEWPENRKKIQTQMERNGFFYVLALRLFPGFSFDLVSYSAAIAKVRFVPFSIATIIGIIPGTFALNFVGSSFISGNPAIITGAIAVFIVLTSGLALLRNRWKRTEGTADRM
ncbi:TVP38/TMEM64 family inner membrane protein YdjZ [Planococcus massiliensis]|uniref:TVP38/TMEM64 family membrane protein n=1 Tax=Planococcus massiliensis TaxID=1499687 RepID=A0A098EHH6_9BACL|nr:TVP38/TMEM64 family protein [Planococcus massiliensis]CEG21759.1 TVP38/TMEM64 family inner membrane protein YdjZ [Planococcus massiliensis]